MGLINDILSLLKKPATLQEEIEEVLEEPEFQLQVTGISIFLSTLFVLRFLITSRMKKLSGEHVLDLTQLDRAILAKEVFLAYLNAALLEPVLTFSAMEQLDLSSIMIETLTFLSLCWWIWLVSDAFSCDDVVQQFRYSSELREETLKDPNRFSWIHIKKNSSVKAAERDDLNGNLKVDIALWFMLGSILSAWLPGAVTHGQAIHAYAVVILWAIMHHFCYQATHWGMGYVNEINSVMLINQSHKYLELILKPHLLTYLLFE